VSGGGVLRKVAPGAWVLLRNFCTFGEMDFIARIEESQKSNIQEIAKSLEKMGIRINRIMRITGTISGSSSSLPLAQIKIKGIKSVEQNRRLRAH
jgi:hypothetical protein